jgi:phosphoserine phosphatase
VTRIILVRHGESTYNVEQRVQGHCDESVLTENGLRGAQNVGVALQGLKVDAAYSSPLQRAKHTAEIICTTLQATHSTLQLQPTDLLKEINLPWWEGLLFSDVKQKYPDEYQAWRKAPHTLKMSIANDAGETIDFFPLAALYEQAQAFWKTLLAEHSGQTILVVAHSGINRALICTALGMGSDRYQAMHQSNCGISILNFKGQLGDPVQLESLNLTAHLGQQVPPPRQNAGVRLLLVRHGETDWNRQGRFQGQIDVPLNDNGRVQAGHAAQFLGTIPLNFAYSSPMLRPKETAEIILQQQPNPLELLLRDGLREISHGLWEGKFESEIESEFPGQLQQWHQTPETVQMPEGENLQQVWDRATVAWDTLVAEMAQAGDELQTGLVVAHDATNKVILSYVLGVGTDYFWQFKQGNGAVSVIDYPEGLDGPAILQAMNITVHLGGVLDQTAAGAL